MDFSPPFFTADLLNGAKLYVFAAIERGTRRIRILGATENPVQIWVVQQARNLLIDGTRTAKAATSITAMIAPHSEQLITIDELRTLMPDLRARETTLRGQLSALGAQIADRDAYLRLAGDLEGFLVSGLGAARQSPLQWAEAAVRRERR